MTLDTYKIQAYLYNMIHCKMASEKGFGALQFTFLVCMVTVTVIIIIIIINYLGQGPAGLGVATPMTCPLPSFYLINHSFIQLFIHSFIHPSVHLFAYSFIHSLIRSFIHSFIHSFPHSPPTCVPFILTPRDLDVVAEHFSSCSFTLLSLIVSACDREPILRSRMQGHRNLPVRFSRTIYPKSKKKDV